jgi:hypothetical protein
VGCPQTITDDGLLIAIAIAIDIDIVIIKSFVTVVSSGQERMGGNED